MIIYQSLDTHRHHIRLITILPLVLNAPQSATVECHLQDVCIDDEHFTPAYKLFLNDKDAPGAWKDPEHLPDLLSPDEELGEWINISSPNNDATTHMPEFRYEWGDFMALSYTWGDPTIGCEILVNGHSLMVTKNVDDCLRALRKKQYTQAGWKYWIDAICINQKDIIERASQVKRMREIYSKAWTPIIWVGEQVQGSHDALDLIETLSRDYSSRDGVIQLTDILHQNPDHFGKGRWRALNEVACRRYWRRLWILQEAALGRSTTPVLCGDRTVPWAQFPQAFDMLAQTDEVINTYITNELSEVNLQFDLALWANLNTVYEIQVLQDRYLNSQRSNMYRLLLLSRTVFATDPRDKVYGLLGLMEESVAKLIEPDYTDTVTNVYNSFTLATIKGTGSLDILRHSAFTEGSSLPSWLPLLRVEPAQAALTISDNAFATSGSSLAYAQPLADAQLLSCKGFVIDYVDGMGCLWSNCWLPESVIASKRETDPYGCFEAAREAIWKSLIACHSVPSEPLDPALDNSGYAALLATPALSTMVLPQGSSLKDLVNSNVFAWCVQSLHGNADFHVAGRRMEEYFWTEVDPQRIDAVHLRAALMQKDRVGLNRKLITTEGGYVGLALETVEQGDAMAVLLGCSMPIVLRKVEGEDGDVRWRVIGECYVHGFMHGEAMEWGLETRDIVLC